MTRTVTGIVKHLDGSAWASASITFILIDAFETATSVYPTEEHIEVADAIGAFSTELGVPDTGTAHYRVRLPDNSSYDFYVGSGAPVDLVTLITIASALVAPSALQTLLDAAAVLSFKTVTSTYVVLPTDNYIRCDGTFTVTLPPATGSALVYAIKNVGTGLITIDGDGADTINGVATYLIYENDNHTFVDVAVGAWDSL